MNSSRLSTFCDRALEAGWLLGVTITPVFFNVYSDRVFEPDKLTTQRALAVVMAVLWLVRFLEQWIHDEKPLRFSWRTPMVLPAALTMTLYLISSAFSLVPYTSFIGSYQRLQGTYTLFGYLTIFFAILTSLRTRAQLSRLITVLILNSLPVSLYGIIQHNGLDPLPWAGNVQTRVASNMGNSIFVAAYLILIVPLTSARIIESFNDILNREESRISDVLRASGYIFLLAVQMLTILYSRSRGPWMGMITAIFLFPYLGFLVLLRRARADEPEVKGSLRDVGKGIAMGLGSLALAGLLLGLSVLAFEDKLSLYIGGGLALLVFGGIWLYFVVERKGWRWLWIGWGMIGVAIMGGLLAINVPGPLHDKVKATPSVSRFAQITELESGTGKVRVLIWQGGIQLISPHPPIKFPDGHGDPFNAIRPLIGYGPESMYVAYNSFYPPLLGHYESRTASPDRSHNETLDSLVITGVLGLFVYLFTFLSVFYWGFRWLGLLETRKQLWLMLGLDAAMALLFFLIAWQVEGAYLFVVAIPLGVVVGTVLYLTVVGFQTLLGQETPSEQPRRLHPHAILLIAILSSVIAHYVEINFAIAIAATRTTFWTLSALLVVLGLEWVPGTITVPQVALPPREAARPQSAARRRKKKAAARRRAAAQQSAHRGLAPWISAVLSLTLAATFLMGTLAYDFVNNPERLSDAGQILIHSLTVKQYPHPTQSFGALLIFLFTWLLFGVVGLGEYDRENLFHEHRASRWGIAVMLYVVISLIGWLFFALLLAGHQAALTQVQANSIEMVVAVAERLSSILNYYYWLIFIILFVNALVLMGEETKLPRTWGELWSPVLLVILLLISVAVIRSTDLNLIRADIIFKQGKVFANNNNLNDKQIGIAHYQKSLEYVPHEDYYDLFLGKAYLELAQIFPTKWSALSKDQQDAQLKAWESSVSWASLTPDQQQQQIAAWQKLWEQDRRKQQTQIFQETEKILTHAREINPLNTDHSANLARFYKSWAARIASDLRDPNLSDEEKARLKQQRDDLLEKSLENYHIALTLSPHNPIIWNELAQLYAIDFGDMVKFNETITKSLQVDPDFETTWMLLGDMRSSHNDIPGAIDAYKHSLAIKKWSRGSSRQERCTVMRVLGTLQAQEKLWDDSVATLSDAVDYCARANDLWEMYRVLAIAYANQGHNDLALQAATQALSLAPENNKDAIQQLINSLQQPQQPVGPQPAP